MARKIRESQRASREFANNFDWPTLEARVEAGETFKAVAIDMGVEAKRVTSFYGQWRRRRNRRVGRLPQGRAETPVPERSQGAGDEGIAAMLDWRNNDAGLEALQDVMLAMASFDLEDKYAPTEHAQDHEGQGTQQEPEQDGVQGNHEALDGTVTRLPARSARSAGGQAQGERVDGEERGRQGGTPDDGSGSELDLAV